MSPPPRQPPDYGSNAWLYEQMERRFDDLSRRMDKHGQQLTALGERLTEHDEQDQLVENRVLTIEIERRKEEAERRKEREDRADHVRKITLDNSKLSATIATGASIIVQIIKSTWDTYHH